MRRSRRPHSKPGSLPKHRRGQERVVSLATSPWAAGHWADPPAARRTGWRRAGWRRPGSPRAGANEEALDGPSRSRRIGGDEPPAASQELAQADTLVVVDVGIGKPRRHNDGELRENRWAVEPGHERRRAGAAARAGEPDRLASSDRRGGPGRDRFRFARAHVGLDSRTSSSSRCSRRHQTVASIASPNVCQNPRIVRVTGGPA
jgi:hypothetical protein